MPVQRPRRGAAGDGYSSAGLLLLDASMRPLCADDEAMRIVSYSEKCGNSHCLRDFLREEIRLVSFGQATAPWPQSAGAFLSGRRHYLYRMFVLQHDSKNPTAPALAVLLERCHSITADVNRAAEEFHLTERERQALLLLFEGLTIKEIAARMGISANTVKVFLRLVMAKMRVTTRFGIAGKILGPTQEPRIEPGVRPGRAPESDALRPVRRRKPGPQERLGHPTLFELSRTTIE